MSSFDSYSEEEVSTSEEEESVERESFSNDDDDQVPQAPTANPNRFTFATDERYGSSNKKSSPSNQLQGAISSGEKKGGMYDETSISETAHTLNRFGTNDGDGGQGTPQGGSGGKKAPAKPAGPKLSWKSDPVASFSDWRIEILNTDTGESDTYHVHRNMIGFGARVSQYFLRRFKKAMKDPSNYGKSNFSILELEKGKADVFPMILDFLYYTKEVKQTLTAERACAVYSVSGQLEIPALQKAVTDFYRKNLSLNNMGEFLAAAAKYKADDLLFVAKAKIGALITERPELAGLVPPLFLADIIGISRNHNKELHAKDPIKYSRDWELAQSRYWSKAACICAAHHEAELNPTVLEALTNEDVLPAIDVSVALKLLSIDSKFNDGGSGFSSLQNRCVESITESWDAFQGGFDTPAEVSGALKILPSHVLADILVKSMSRPQRPAPQVSKPVVPQHRMGGADEEDLR
jgi:hypothetical protein